MKYNFVRLLNEHSLNKIIRDNKNSKEVFGILYISLWDNVCEKILGFIQNFKDSRAEKQNYRPTVYIVDSFNMPHSFVIHNVVKVPHLVMYTNKGITSTDITSSIYNLLGFNNKSNNSN